MLVVLPVLMTSAAWGADYPRPEPGIRSVVADIVEDVAVLRESPDVSDCALYALVDEHLRSQFNLYRSSRGILTSRHWPGDDPTLQARFVEAFYNFLVAKYGDLLIHFDSDTLQVFDRDQAPEIDRSTVKTLLTMTSGEKVEVDLTMRFIDGRWQILNVIARRAGDGTHSYANYYSDLFLDEIYDSDFDGLIAWLEEEAAPRGQCGQ